MPDLRAAPGFGRGRTVLTPIDHDGRRNVVYYGNGSWGVQQASEGYFNTAPSHLTWGEASMLAGLLQAPSAYDPLEHYTLARERQRHVLSQLVVNHYLTRAEATTAFNARLPLS
ncbi:MAG TPA: transglycosylase domain-containing protein [Solirubrobacteraceae bacterium]|nr:transglycosylase domain-containing protein [Solirubrobacteraceae bacterium]